MFIYKQRQNLIATVTIKFSPGPWTQLLMLTDFVRQSDFTVQNNFPILVFWNERLPGKGVWECKFQFTASTGRSHLNIHRMATKASALNANGSFLQSPICKGFLCSHGQMDLPGKRQTEGGSIRARPATSRTPGH